MLFVYIAGSILFVHSEDFHHNFVRFKRALPTYSSSEPLAVWPFQSGVTHLINPRIGFRLRGRGGVQFGYSLHVRTTTAEKKMETMSDWGHGVSLGCLPTVRTERSREPSGGFLGTKRGGGSQAPKRGFVICSESILPLLDIHARDKRQFLLGRSYSFMTRSSKTWIKSKSDYQLYIKQNIVSERLNDLKVAVSTW